MKIKTTLEYNRFKLFPENREIIESHVDAIIKLMEKKCLPIPIFVNEDYYVLDGQHTLKAREKLGYNVPYIEIKGATAEDIPYFNIQRKNWNATDYMIYYCEQGYEQYQRYSEVYNKYQLGHNVTMQILLGSCNQGVRNIFKAGSIVCMIGPEIDRELSLLGDISKHTTLATKTTVVTGLRLVFKEPWYDHSRFTRNLKTQSKKLAGVKVDDGLRALERVYNFRSKNPHRFF